MVAPVSRFHGDGEPITGAADDADDDGPETSRRS
jgi:hypothetical protein